MHITHSEALEIDSLAVCENPHSFLKENKAFLPEQIEPYKN